MSSTHQDHSVGRWSCPSDVISFAFQVLAALYVISVIGSWFNFLTLVFLGEWSSF